MKKYLLYLSTGAGKRGGIMLEDARTITSYRLTSEVGVMMRMYNKSNPIIKEQNLFISQREEVTTRH